MLFIYYLYLATCSCLFLIACICKVDRLLSGNEINSLCITVFVILLPFYLLVFSFYFVFGLVLALVLVMLSFVIYWMNCYIARLVSPRYFYQSCFNLSTLLSFYSSFFFNYYSFRLLKTIFSYNYDIFLFFSAI